MTDLKVIKSIPSRVSLGQHVYRNLREAIVRGDLEPGHRIVESRVAETLGISRTPVREAIHKLEREGLLDHDPKGGFFVVGLTRADIEETFGLRGLLESYAARLAAVQHQAEELGPLRDKIREYQDRLGRGGMKELPRINTEFHDLLYALSRSPRLIRMINHLRDQIFRFRKVLLSSEELARTSSRDHQLILELIRQRDAEAVDRLVREHIERGKQAVLRELYP